jgi:hypothetical protein
MTTSTAYHAARDNALSPQHRYELEAESAIDPAIIAERGYFTASTAANVPGVFGDYQRRPGLVIPIRDTTGRITTYQLKADQPRLSKNGKPRKYETAEGGRMGLDVPARSLPHLGDPSKELWITEGIKKVDAGLSHGIECIVGLLGVWNFRGKNKLGGVTALADWESTAPNGRDIVIAYDSDAMTEPEIHKALKRLSAFLTQRGARVRYCLMPKLPNGGKCGLDDWFAAGHTIDELRQYVVDSLPPIDDQSVDETSTPVLVSLADVAPKEVDWLFEGWLPRRMLTILGGYAGDGKSTLVANLVAAFSRGGTLPDGTPAPVVNTLLLAAEDDLEYAVSPRLRVHGADPSRVLALQGVRRGDGPLAWLDLRRDIELVRAAVQANDIGLVVIDPLSAYMPKSDRNSEGDVRDALMPLQSLMEDTGVAVLGIMHVGKSDAPRRAALRLLGSTAFTALARTVWMVHDLPERLQDGRDRRRVLGVVKSNYAIPPASLQFSRTLNGPIIFHGSSPMSVEEALEEGAPSRQPKRDKAVAWLSDFLAGGMQRAVDVERGADESGITKSTLKRAHDDLKVQHKKVGFPGEWYWMLPTSAPLAEEDQVSTFGGTEGDHAAQGDEMSTFGETEEDHVSIFAETPESAEDDHPLSTSILPNGKREHAHDPLYRQDEHLRTIEREVSDPSLAVNELHTCVSCGLKTANRYRCDACVAEAYREAGS